MVVTPNEAGTGGLGLTIIDLAAYFYVNDGLVALNQPERLQRAFDLLFGFFGQPSLRTHTTKMIDVVCQPCHAPGGGFVGSLCATGDE